MSGTEEEAVCGNTLYFVTRVLPKYCEDIRDELKEAVLKKTGTRVFTIDPTPLEAGRYNFQAKYNSHYEIKMDKSHTLMASGFPMIQIHTDGLAADCPIAKSPLYRLRGIRFGKRCDDVILTDGAYDSFVLYADAWMATGYVV